MRLALKIAYDGTLYHGYARQPGIETIEGALEKKLREMGAIGEGEHLQVASRTDKGVSAAGNVIAFDTDMESESVANALAHSFRGIWVLGFAEVPEGFNPRHAVRKKYRYYLYNDGIDIGMLKKALNKKSRANFGIAPPENLLLMNLYYKKTLKFHSVEKTLKFISEMAKKMEVRASLSKDMARVCRFLTK